jgi:hypothetical protein
MMLTDPKRMLRRIDTAPDLGYTLDGSCARDCLRCPQDRTSGLEWRGYPSVEVNDVS